MFCTLKNAEPYTSDTIALELHTEAPHSYLKNYPRIFKLLPMEAEIFPGFSNIIVGAHFT